MSEEKSPDPKPRAGLPIRVSLALPNGALLMAAAGALAVGAVAIGAVAIGRLTIGRLRVRRLEVDELTVRRVKGL